MRNETERYELALDKVAAYTGKDARILALDEKLADGGSLTTAEVDMVLRFFRWDNMSKGN